MYFPSLESHWLDLINKKRFEKGLRWIHHFSLTTIYHLYESFKKYIYIYMIIKGKNEKK